MKILLIATVVAGAFAWPIFASATDLLPKPPAEQGTVAYNEWLGRSFSEVMLNEPDQDKRIEMLNVLVAEDYIQHNPLVPEGRQGLIDFIPVIYQSMPDARFTLHDVFATEERVVTRWTWEGTLTEAPLLGISLRGKSSNLTPLMSGVSGTANSTNTGTSSTGHEHLHSLASKACHKLSTTSRPSLQIGEGLT